MEILKRALDMFPDVNYISAFKVSFITIVYYIVIASLLNLIYGKSEDIKSSIEKLMKQPILNIILFLLGAAFLEELIFRLPLAIFSLDNAFIVVVISTVIFALVHNGNRPIRKLLVQGTAGVIYSLVFIKSGGLENPIVGIYWSTLYHFVTNAMILLPVKLTIYRNK